jgi:hypothetical protein
VLSENMLAAIAKSTDVSWLAQCRDFNKLKGNDVVAQAADKRGRDLQLAAALKMNACDGTLEGRIMESLRVYREMLKHKHGRNQAAGYTERDIKKHGPTGALIATIRREKRTDGLTVLQSFGRLDCSYEQIAVDFASELPDDVVEQARKMLAELDGEADEHSPPYVTAS